jgi:hypothetical protein
MFLEKHAKNCRKGFFGKSVSVTTAINKIINNVVDSPYFTVSFISENFLNISFQAYIDIESDITILILTTENFPIIPYKTRKH